MRSNWRDGDRSRSVELGALGPGRWRVRVDESEFELAAELLPDGRLRLSDEQGTVLAEVSGAGERRFVRLDGLDFMLERERGGRRVRTAHDHGLEAPMPGVVTRVMVKAGDEVKKGQPLVALEAMKMEHLIRAPRDGRVKSVAATLAAMAQGGQKLVELDEEAPPA
jgi:biotin carboxyl carrier protein